MKAVVKNGRLVVDEPCSLPEGTEMELVIADEDPQLDAVEAEALERALTSSWKQAVAGATRPATGLLEELRRGG